MRRKVIFGIMLVLSSISCTSQVIRSDSTEIEEYSNRRMEFSSLELYSSKLDNFEIKNIEVDVGSYIPVFMNIIDNYDRELFESILDYKPPTALELQTIKSKYGDELVRIVIDRDRIHNIFINLLEIRKVIQLLDGLSNVLTYTQDYEANTKILTFLGDRAKFIKSIDSLIVTRISTDISPLLATLLGKYDIIHKYLNDYCNDRVVSILTNYTFEGSSDKQLEDWNNIFKKNQYMLPTLINECNVFLKIAYEDFSELSKYLKNKYPEIIDLTNN
jgi:hypothetical protein